ncbi:MAG: TIGR03620 family F420-dependent LLM class oxidoreductase [Frankia sp.]|nr:TIGR03620 family F420-dependent LLM class oxidoreductase [Frankia sp.]
MTITDPIGISGLGLDANAGPAAEAEAAVRLEELGYRTLWLAGGQSNNLPQISAVIRATSTLRVASGILPVLQVPPAETAAAYAELEAEHPGRFIVGLGGAHGPKPLQTLNAYLDALDAARPPVPASARILAALGPQMLELARDRASGAYPYLVTTDYVGKARELLGPGPTLAVLVPVIPITDPTAAREFARALLGMFATIPGYRNNFARMGFTEADITGLSDTFLDAVTVWGDLDRIAARVREYQAAGADQVALGIRLPEDGSAGDAATWQARLASALLG